MKTCTLTFLISNALATRRSEFRFLDFSALIQQVFGRDLAIFWQIFCQKNQGILAFVIFSADSLHLAEFQNIIDCHAFGRRRVRA